MDASVPVASSLCSGTMTGVGATSQFPVAAFGADDLEAVFL